MEKIKILCKRILFNLGLLKIHDEDVLGFMQYSKYFQCQGPWQRWILLDESKKEIGYMWFTKNPDLIRIGTIGYGIAFTVGVIQLVFFFKRRLEKARMGKDSDSKPERSPNLIKEFVKAKYNRYCPRIDWRNQKDCEKEEIGGNPQ